MCHITKPVWFSAASKLANPARIRSDHFFTTRHAIKNFAKNWKTVCVKVHVRDLISTTYHYASKVWLIF